MSGNDTTNFDNDTSGNHGVPFDTSPDLSGDQGGVWRPHPEDTMQDSTRSRGFQPQGQGTDATQKDIPDETQQEFHSPSDGEIQRDYSADRTDQDIRTQKTADHSGQITDQDIGDGQQKVWADPFAQENTSDEGGLGFKRQNPAFDKTAKSGAADFADTSGDTNWDALDKPRAGSSGFPSQSASMTPQSNPKKSPVGQTFANKYEIVGQIGQGGMGIVYKANDMILARTVAIKVIKANSQAKVEEISRFQLEAKSIAKLDHPNIIRVYEMNVTTDGDPYFVLEYIAGNSLSNEIRGRKGLPLNETIEIVDQVCDALNHAHESGVIHRDLKPSNIMLVKLRDRVVVKLLDFGIAKHFAVDDATLQLLQLTRPGQAFGSPHYMSPEQSRGQADSPASDIYSLGCMFFEMITGHPPFSGDNVLTTMNMHQTEEIPSVGDAVDEKFRAEVDQIIARMMAKRPEDRYLSVMDAKGDLLELRCKMKQPEISELAPAPSVSNVVYEVGDKRPGKNRTKIFASLVAVLIVGAVGIFSAGVIRGVKPSPPDVKDLTPWKAYDLKGQQLFDKGAYKPALLNFQKAYERAKLEKDGPDKATKLNTSLRELRSINYVLGDSKAVDTVNQELLDHPIQTSAVPKVPFERLKKSIASLSKENISERWDPLIEKVTAAVTDLRTRESSRPLLDLVQKQVTSIGNEQARLQQLEIIRAYISFDEQVFKTGDYSVNSVERLKRILIEQRHSVTPQVGMLLVKMLQDDPAVDQAALVEIIYRAQSGQNLFIRDGARYLGSNLQWNAGNRDAALLGMKELLAEVESRPARTDSDLSRVLTALGYWHTSMNQFEVAVPLLKRAASITILGDVEPSAQAGQLNLIEFQLALSYANLKHYDDAIRLQKRILNRAGTTSGASSYESAVALYGMGRIQFLANNLDEAALSLEKSREILRHLRGRSVSREQLLAATSALLNKLSDAPGAKPVHAQ
ncbi:serine/threonine protein kinase [Candidatus Obscuribacterales bacterium]|nr:serine/threonine protein kinase [Candidatus Obscuribacterales bacterium]